MSEKKFINIEPSLDGYKKILGLLKKMENKTAEDVKTIEQLEQYIEQEEKKNEEGF